MPREITGALGSGETHRVFPGWKVPQKDVDSPSSTIRPQATPSKFPARTSVDPDKMARKCIEKDKDAVTARTTLKKVSKLEESGPRFQADHREDRVLAVEAESQDLTDANPEARARTSGQKATQSCQQRTLQQLDSRRQMTGTWWTSPRMQR